MQSLSVQYDPKKDIEGAFGFGGVKFSSQKKKEKMADSLAVATGLNELDGGNTDRNLKDDGIHDVYPDLGSASKLHEISVDKKPKKKRSK